MKNTDNNNEPPNDDDDATAVAVDCFPWQDKQPVLLCNTIKPPDKTNPNNDNDVSDQPCPDTFSLV